MEVLLRTCLLLAIFAEGWSDTGGPSLAQSIQVGSDINLGDNRDIMAGLDIPSIQATIARMKITDIEAIIADMGISDLQAIIAFLNKPDIQNIITGMNLTDFKDIIAGMNISDIQAIIDGMCIPDIKDIITGMNISDIQAIIAAIGIPEIKDIIAGLDIPDIKNIIAGMNWTDILHNLKDINWSDILSNIMDYMRDTANVSQHCRLDVTRYGLDLLQRKNYALQMLDACGKPPSGILTGNFNWLGRYSQCSKLKGVDHNITFNGKYFLATFKLEAFNLNIGLCLPSSCSDADVTTALTNSTPAQAPGILQVTAIAQETSPIDGGTVAAICICGVLGLFLLLGTTYDVMIHQPRTEATKTEKNKKGSCEAGKVLSKSTTEEEGVVGRILMSFSIYTNITNLLSTEHPPNSIRCLHGIRVLSMSWIILAHTYYYGQNTADNMLTLLETTKQFTTQVILSGHLPVDSFFLLSGLLLSYQLLKQIEKSHKNGKAVSYSMIYVQRYLRLTPTYMFVLMLFVWTYSQLFSGPMFDYIDVKLCQQHWWTNLLYIQNIAIPGTSSDQCIGWTWYLANDMQFFVIGVPLVYLMYRWWYVGVAALLHLLLASFVITALLVTDRDLTGRVIDGERAGRTIYDKPYYRIGPYLVGLAMGWLLLKTEGKIRGKSKIMKVLVFTGWCVATASALTVVYGQYGTYHGVVMTIHERALFFTVHRTVWALALAWVVFACYHGYGGVVNSILSWGAWVPLARLTYCNYLLHSIVMLVYYDTRDVPAHFSNLDVIYYFLGHSVLSYGLAFLLSVAVEVPLMRLLKVTLGARTKQTANPPTQDVRQDSEQASKAVATPGSDACTKF